MQSPGSMLCYVCPGVLISSIVITAHTHLRIARNLPRSAHASCLLIGARCVALATLALHPTIFRKPSICLEQARNIMPLRMGATDLVRFAGFGPDRLAQLSLRCMRTWPLAPYGTAVVRGRCFVVEAAN